jgi:hypothetical protein
VWWMMLVQSQNALKARTNREECLGAVAAEDVDSETPMSFLIESEDEILSTTSPLQDQMLNFYKKIASYEGNPIQLFAFFSRHEKELYIDSRVALVVLAIPLQK